MKKQIAIQLSPFGPLIEKKLQIEENVLAKSGIASRRKSDELIKMAMTTVNNEIILDPAYQVKSDDEVRFDGKILKIDEDKIVIIFSFLIYEMVSSLEKSSLISVLTLNFFNLSNGIWS